MDKDILLDYWLRCKNENLLGYGKTEEYEKKLFKLIDKKEVEMDDVPRDLMSPKVFMRICRTDLNRYKDILIEEIEAGRLTLNNLPKELRAEKDYILPLIKRNPSIYKTQIPEELKKDKDIIFSAVKADPFIFYYIPDEAKKNRELVLECIKNDGYILKYLNKELKNDDEIVYEAFKVGLAHYDEEDYARKDYVYMIQILDKDYIVKDKNIAKKIIMNSKSEDEDCELKDLIRYFSNELKQDSEIINLLKEYDLYDEIIKN